jgi:hypothetical protein
MKLSFIGIAALWIICSTAAAASEDQIRDIDTANAILRINERSCNLVGIKWKSPELEVIAEPRLGENFRVLLPKPGYEANYFYSTDQNVSGIEETGDGIVCHYESLRNAREHVAVNVDYRIRAVGKQVQFSIEIDNRTDRKVAEVYYAILGGLQGVGDRHDTETLIPGATDNLAPSMFRNFQGGGYGGGNLGIRYEASGFTYPGAMSMGWMDVWNPKINLGFYYANQDPETRLTALYTELRPFTKSASVSDNWATPDDVPASEPIGMTIGWVNFPYAGKGKFESGPIALQVHSGDWHTASTIYREWFDQHFSLKRPLSWLRKEMAWQSIILSNPEDVIVHRFEDLPRLASDAKKYGVTTFEILGWDTGGIDRGYPQYRPNPRLGTAEEFRQALKAMRAEGIHPLIFSNIQVADTATPLFRKKLSRYAVRGRWAADLRIVGYGEGTIGARLGLSLSNMAAVSPSHPAFREFLLEQYLQLVKDGADGFQFDKTSFDGMLDFNPLLPVSPDKSILPGVIATFKELLDKAREINPDFALASEIWTDRAFPYVDVSYMRMNNIDMGSPALRYTFPEWTATIFGESPGDFNPMNNGMRYGLVWALAPRHYNDSLDEPLTRPLSLYVSELIRIRTEYRDLLFHGRFNDTIGAKVNGDADVRFSVFEPMEHNSGQRAAVVVNYGDHEEEADVEFPDAPGREVEISAPFEPTRTATLPVHLKLPPRHLAVVVMR